MALALARFRSIGNRCVSFFFVEHKEDTVGQNWEIIFHPDQSIEYRLENNPSVSLKAEFQGSTDIEEQPQSLSDGGTRLVVRGTLRLKSIPGTTFGSWDIGAAGHGGGQHDA
jgi:hypothetical protein